ncbi:hypothetical protein N7540_009271 [Penicillium herquei]|nr:hypothetical protein N7540_009271 [Penicillium herquei]
MKIVPLENESLQPRPSRSWYQGSSWSWKGVNSCASVGTANGSGFVDEIISVDSNVVFLCMQQLPLGPCTEIEWQYDNLSWEHVWFGRHRWRYEVAEGAYSDLSMRIWPDASKVARLTRHGRPRGQGADVKIPKDYNLSKNVSSEIFREGPWAISFGPRSIPQEIKLWTAPPSCISVTENI